jgi:hypothetical protein
MYLRWVGVGDEVAEAAVVAEVAVVEVVVVATVMPMKIR